MNKNNEKRTPDPSAFGGKNKNTNQPDGMTTDIPDLRQIAVTVCTSFLDEVDRGNSKYPHFFRSSAETSGVLYPKSMKVFSLLGDINSVNGMALDQESFDRGEELKKALVVLGAMCIKASYSMCNWQVELEAASAKLEQAQKIATMVNGENQTR